MAVGTAHPSCFAVAHRLYVVPSWSPYGIAETRRSLLDATGAASPIRSRRTPWVGGLAGGLLLTTVAVTTWGVVDLLETTELFVVGGAVGAVLALGVRALVAGESSAGRSSQGPLPAVEIPIDVARWAPDDSSDDELVLWSTRVARFRAAEEALADEAHTLRSRGPHPAVSENATTAGVADAYRAARAEYEPVARLLGLPLN